MTPKRETKGSRSAGARTAKAKARVARKAAASAPKGRADRGGLTRHEKALRDSAIVAAAHAGMGTGAIAAEWGISQRAVQLVIKNFGELASPLDKRPMQLLEEVVRIYRRQILDFARTAAVQAERNPSVSLGAQKAASDALERYVSLLQDLGKLPENLELLRAQDELTRIVTRVADLLEEAAQGRIALVEVQAEFDRLLSPSTSLYDVEGTATELPPGE